MAFIRKETKKSVTYLRLVESYRDADGKNRHRTLYNLGKARDYSPESLKRMGQVLYELGGGTLEDLESKQLKENGRYYYGFPLVVRKLLKEYSLDRFLQRRASNSGVGYNLTDSVCLLICERFHDPVSKLANYKNQDDYLGLSKIELHQVYRTLDHLYESQEQLKHMIYQKGRDLFNQKLDVVFYDVTTFYFDSDKEDGFREKGFGKDGKIGKTIIVFGIQGIEIKYYITTYKNKKLITTYSKKRAARDKAQREEKIEKAKKLMQNPSQLEKKAKIHFLKKQGKNTYVFDQDKISNSERFDGFLSVATNNKNLSVPQILDAYKQLYKIEQSFRSFKTFLETRPMYHWTEKRILGHLALCYISFTLLNHLQLRLRQKQAPLTENQIRKGLMKMQVSLLRQDKKEYYLTSKTPENAHKIMKALRIRNLPDLIPKEAINKYL